MNDIVKFVHLLSIVVWLGMLLFFTFLAAPSIFKVLPREAAGAVVGDIFPKYWAVGYVAGALSLITLIIISYAEKGFPAARILILAVMTATTFYSGLSVGARAREIKAEIRVTEEAGKKEALRKDFLKVHFISSVLNIVVIALGLVLVFLTARGMRV